MLIRFYIETVGCQMNVLDSELAAAGLLENGFSQVSDIAEADVILFNTCSVRQHAEDKVYSALGRLRPWKNQNQESQQFRRVLGVLGCMAQKDNSLIFRRAPHVDLVVGPGQLAQLPSLILECIQSYKNRILEISLNRFEPSHRAGEVKASFVPYNPERMLAARHSPFQALVRVMYGCDQFCTYCIVPAVRGPEQSRPPAEIFAEARQLADQGCVELTLIGQTVNRYRYTSGEKTYRLSDLLEHINTIDGIRRIRFLTNYPRGMTDDLLFAVRDLEKVAPFFHVPAQSGADTVLARMKRNYTVAEYKSLLDKMAETVQGAAVTSDFIVGFCGETEEEFEATCDLVRYGRFKNSFIFKYSAREGTKAAVDFADDVPEDVKKRRNSVLLGIQDEISLELNRQWIGRTVEILVEGAGGKPDQLSGRTACDRICVFDVPSATATVQNLIGTFVNIRITEAAPFTLFGEYTAKSSIN